MTVLLISKPWIILCNNSIYYWFIWLIITNWVVAIYDNNNKTIFKLFTNRPYMCFIEVNHAFLRYNMKQIAARM